MTQIAENNLTEFIEGGATEENQTEHLEELDEIQEELEAAEIEFK